MSELLCNLFYYSSKNNDMISKIHDLNIDYPDEFTDDMFEEMWTHDKNQFIIILFYLRSHRKQSNKIVGPGNKTIFYHALLWMSYTKLSELLIIIPYIPDCGYWKDLLILMGTPAEIHVIRFFGTQLMRDYESYNKTVSGFISLAAKWTPNEGSSSDKKYNTNRKIATFLNVSRKILRTQYLVPLRKYLSITEQLITDKNWSAINYQTVPKLSLKTHSEIFLKNDNTRFTSYINTSHSDYITNLYLPPSLSTIYNKPIINLPVSNKSINYSTLNIIHDKSSNQISNKIINKIINDNATIANIMCINTMNNNATNTTNNNIISMLKNNIPNGKMKDIIAIDDCDIVVMDNIITNSSNNNKNTSIINSMNDKTMNNNIVGDITSVKPTKPSKPVKAIKPPKPINCDALYAVDISGSMAGFPITLAACLCKDSNANYWIPFCIDSDDYNNSNFKLQPMSGNNPRDKIDCIIDSCLLKSLLGYNMRTCTQIAEKLGKSHIIFISNILLDKSEYPCKLSIHVTYWSINMNAPVIIDSPNLTVIEGYSKHIYEQLQYGHILTKYTYKDIIMSALMKDNIIPVI